MLPVLERIVGLLVVSLEFKILGRKQSVPKWPPTGKKKLRSTVKGTKEVTLVGTGGR